MFIRRKGNLSAALYGHLRAKLIEPSPQLYILKNGALNFTLHFDSPYAGRCRLLKDRLFVPPDRQLRRLTQHFYLALKRDRRFAHFV
jgi:hypothetical protein